MGALFYDSNNTEKFEFYYFEKNGEHEYKDFWGFLACLKKDP